MALSCLVVVADYQSPRTVDKIADQALTTGCGVHIVAKGADGCRHSPVGATCEEQPNLGDDAASATRYVWQHYDELPDRLLFVPSSTKWARLPAFRMMLSDVHSPEDSFKCLSMNAGQLGTLRRWSLDYYRSGGSTKGNLTLATPRPLGRWLAFHTRFDHQDLSVPVCAHLLFLTSRSRLRERTRKLYANLTLQLEAAPHTEATHYVERAVGAIFAGRRRWWNLFCGGEPLCPEAAAGHERGLLWWRQNISIGIPPERCQATRALECRRKDGTKYSCWC